jgi:hypothetical protein
MMSLEEDDYYKNNVLDFLILLKLGVSKTIQRK